MFFAEIVGQTQLSLLVVLASAWPSVGPSLGKVAKPDDRRRWWADVTQAEDDEYVADILRNGGPENAPPSEDVAGVLAVRQGRHWCASAKIMQRCTHAHALWMSYGRSPSSFMA